MLLEEYRQAVNELRQKANTEFSATTDEIIFLFKPELKPKWIVIDNGIYHLKVWNVKTGLFVLNIWYDSGWPYTKAEARKLAQQECDRLNAKN